MGAPSTHQLPTLAELGRDLVHLSAFQRWIAVMLPVTCVAAYIMLAVMGWWIAAVMAVVAYTFFSYGSTSHDLVHANLGLPRRVNDILLSVIELLGLRSGHAYRAVHLHHHKRFPHDDDVDGEAAHRSLLWAVWSGLWHQPRMWWWAIRHAKCDRRWILGEGLACAAILLGAVVVLPITSIPIVYVVLIVMGSWTFPLMTSYIPHTPAGADELTRTRRFRGKVADWLFLQHLYHLEHHLYPGVPHHHWAKLARRLDPHLDRAGVKAIRLGV